jgi:CRP-like cAMP-binding protein
MSAEKDSFARFLKHYTKGTVLFNEGDEGEDMYIIRSGQVAIKKRVPHGDKVVAVLEKGDFFGEMAMLERIPRTAGAEMVEDGDLIVIGSEIFGDMVKSHPEVAVRMLRKYSLRLRETTKQIEELAAKAAAVPAATESGSTIEQAPAEPPRAGRPPAGGGARLLHLQGERERLPGLQARRAHRPLRLGDRAEPRGGPHQRGLRPGTSRGATRGS